MSVTTIQQLQDMLAELALRQEETRKLLSEKFSETDSRFKETDKKVKEAFELFTSQWGRLMESLVEGDLIRILNERGVVVHSTYRRVKGHYNGHSFEYDIIARNGVQVVVVEVKTTLKPVDVTRFLQKLRHFKTWNPAFAENEVIGAVAFLEAVAGAEAMVINKGLFAIRATGDSAAIINPPEFVPKKY